MSMKTLNNMGIAFSSLSPRMNQTLAYCKQTYLQSSTEKKREFFKKGMASLHEDFYEIAKKASDKQLVDVDAIDYREYKIVPCYYDCVRFGAVLIEAQKAGFSIDTSYRVEKIINPDAFLDEWNQLNKAVMENFGVKGNPSFADMEKYHAFLISQFSMLLAGDDKKIDMARRIINGEAVL